MGADHDKKRAIYVIPYTSILEQTANVFREVFGKENVIEHHSNLDPDKEDYRPDTGLVMGEALTAASLAL